MRHSSQMLYLYTTTSISWNYLSYWFLKLYGFLYLKLKYIGKLYIEFNLFFTFKKIPSFHYESFCQSMSIKYEAIVFTNIKRHQQERYFAMQINNSMDGFKVRYANEN